MATLSCVSRVEEQDELVVRTGLELRLQRLDVELMKGKDIVLIGDHNENKKYENMWKLSSRLKEQLGRTCGIYTCTTIRDVSKDLRSNAIIICFSEPSYSGKQSLYHTFWTEEFIKNTCSAYGYYDYTSFHGFQQMMWQLSNTGDAIVFGLDKPMWYPGMKAEPQPQNTTVLDTKWDDSAPLYNDNGELVDPSTSEGIRLKYKRKKEWVEKNPPEILEFPEGEIQSVYATIFGTEIKVRVHAIAHLPPTLKTWILKKYPRTKYVNLGPAMTLPDGMLWSMWGWDEYPSESTSENVDWQESFKVAKVVTHVKKEEPVKDELKTHLASIAETLKHLTNVVGKLAAS